MGTTYHVATEAVLSFLLAVFVCVTIFSASRNADSEARANQYRHFYLAARWLATYNFAQLSALTDVMAKALVMDLRTVQRRIDGQLEKLPYYGCAGQTLRMDAVPLNLQDSAVAYNAMVLENRRGDADFRRPIRAAPDDEIRLLRTAIFVMTRAEAETTLEDIHAATGVPLPFVKAVAMALRSRAEWDVLRLLPIEEPDPESILPSIY
jgi:hypothetical protein